jgi:chemotaxis protein CheD
MPATTVLAIGELDIVRPPDVLKTTVGSCIAIVLFDKRQKLFGMAHIMLPTNDRPFGAPAALKKEDAGKYADTAIMELLRRMGVPLPGAHRLQAKLAGGANMFASEAKSTDSFQIGVKNLQAVTDILNHLKVPILGTDYGGSLAREVWIDTSQYKVFSKKMGEQAVEI